MKESVLWISASALGGILFYFYCVLIGTKLFKILKEKTRIKNQERSDEFFLSTSLGVGVVAFFLLMIGIAKGYTPLVLSIFFILTTGIAITEYKTIQSYCKEAWFFIAQRKEENRIMKGVKWYMIAMFLLYFFVALSPETEWDSISFHLATAKVYVREQAMVPIYYAYHAALPHLFDMLYIIGEIMRSDVFSRVFVLCVNMTIVFGIWQFGKRIFSERAGMLAALLFMTTPVLMVYFPATYVDIPISIFALSAVWCLWQWKKEERKAWFILAVLYAGFAATAKISTVPLLGALFLVYIRYAYKKENGRTIIKTTIWCAGIIALFFLPWVVFNYVHFNNPVYPFAEGMFHGKYWNGELAEWWQYQREHYNTGVGVLQYLLIPLTLTFLPNLTGPIYGFTPVYLMFIPILFCLKKTREEQESMIFLVLVTFISMTGWFIVAPDMRYMFYILPFFAILAGAGITKAYDLLEHKKWKKKIMSTVILLVLFSNLFFFFVIFRNDVKMWVGIITRDEYKAIDTPNYVVAQWTNENLPKDAIIFLANDDKGYYFEQEFITGYGVFSAYIDYPRLENEKAFYARLKELGVTHIMLRVHEDGTLIGYEEYYNEHTENLFRELVEKDATELYTENGCTIYVLK